jgi:tetratricopeptide (TPR) repeat protein
LKYFVAILFFICTVPAGGQKLNEAYLRARAALQQGEYEKVRLEIFSIPQSERTSAMYHTLGESYYMAGDYNNAVSAFTKADSMKSSAAAELCIARSYANLSRPAEAVSWLQKHLNRRDRLFESELQLDPALEKIERSKEWKELWNREWYSAGDRKAAEAMALVKRKKYMDALGVIDGEIAGHPSSASLHALRAVTYTGLEQYEPALESYRKAIQLRNNDPGYFAEAAIVALKCGKYDSALEYIDRAIHLDPYHLEYYLQRAAAYRVAKKYEKAKEDIQFYFTYFPSDKRALYQMGMAETEAGNEIAGIEYFTALIDQDKTSSDYFMARANACMKINSYEMAMNDFSQALDLNPRLADAWLKKGIILHETVDTENACYYWRKALDLGNKQAADYIYKHCIK